MAGPYGPGQDDRQWYERWYGHERHPFGRPRTEEGYVRPDLPDAEGRDDGREHAVYRRDYGYFPGPGYYAHPGSVSPERVGRGWHRLGRGPRGYLRADARILEDVCETIARSGANAENVDVSVRDGEVTLSGTVDDRRQKYILEDLAESVFGVREVHNRIRMSQSTQASQR
jgi:BON domain